MKRAGTALAAVVLVGLVAWILVVTRSVKPEAAAERARVATAATNLSTNPAPSNSLTGSRPALAAGNQLIGESILRGYGTAASTPENDLTLMARLMDNFSLLVKSSANYPMSINEEWAAAFRGRNPAHERFLPDQHVALNAQGQLVDRWNKPLFFHALGGHRFEIRSGGPDGILWTDDDIHRNADGSFRHGAALNPPSLMESQAPGAQY